MDRKPFPAEPAPLIKLGPRGVQMYVWGVMVLAVLALVVLARLHVDRMVEIERQGEQYQELVEYCEADADMVIRKGHFRPDQRELLVEACLTYGP